MKKRIFAFLTALITAFSIQTFAVGAQNTCDVSDAQAYINDNLKNGYLSFPGYITYVISGEAMREFYYNSDIKYYVFGTNGISVRADKNGFFDFDLKKVSFCMSASAFDVIYYYADGAEKHLSRVNVPVRYELSLSQMSSSRTTASFNGETVKALSNEDGRLVFETENVGAFSVIEFEFDDVRESFRWYYNHVNSAGALGILDGMGGSSFEPRSNVTRAQLAAMIVKATQDIISYHIDPSISFKDVPAGKWYYDYVMKCAALGIVDGVGAGMYNPLAGATREEIATVIARLLKLIGKYGETSLPDIDASSAGAELAGLYIDSGSIHNYARESVLLCYKLGIMQGDSEGFRARSKTVRAECAKIFYLINRELSSIK